MNRKTYSLYGIEHCSLDDAKTLVEKSLGVALQAHESSYYCGDYYRHGSTGEEHFVLQSNFDEHEGEWTAPEHTTFPVLLYVNESERPDEIAVMLERLDQVTLLNHEVL